MSTDVLLMHDLRNELSVLKLLVRKLGIKNETIDKIEEVVHSMGEKLLSGYKREGAAKSVVDINESIKSIILCYPDIKFENTIKDPLKVTANGSQLNDALINIIKNSAEAGADTVKFEVRFNSLIIRDNGLCSREVVEKLNNNSVFTTKEKGAGIGTQSIRSLFEGIGCVVLYFLAPNPDPVKRTHGLITRIKLP